MGSSVIRVHIAACLVIYARYEHDYTTITTATADEIKCKPPLYTTISPITG